MKTNICNICGGNLVNKKGKWICEACGAFAPEEITSEESNLLYMASQKLRMADFDDAEKCYLDITIQYPSNCDAYWGLVLSQYGIRYEKDYDGKMIHTCFKTSYESLFDNPNFKKACELASLDQKNFYLTQAEKIEKTRIEWVEKASKEPPYDIFLSYKATELNECDKKTEDYYEAHEIYNELTKLGYKVFFSKESLSDKTGEHYEPYIFNALNTCHMMLVYASKPEFVNSTWVRNEWNRYYKKIKNKEKPENSLVLIYKGFNPEKELIRPFSTTQNLDRNDIHFYDNVKTYTTRVISEANKCIPKIQFKTITHNEVKENKKIQPIKKRIFKEKSQVSKGVFEKVEIRDIGTYSSPKLTRTLETQLQLGYYNLKKEEFQESIKYFEEVLLQNPRNGKASLGKLLSLSACTSLEEFTKKELDSFNEFELLKNVIDYSDKDISEEILKCFSKSTDICLSKGRVSTAYTYYLNIAEYNLDIIQEHHCVIFEKLLKLDHDDDCWFDFIDAVLKYISINHDSYIKCLYALLDSLLRSSEFSKAGIYLDKLRNCSGDSIEYYSYKYRIAYKCSNVDNAFLKIIESDMIKDTEKEANQVSQEIADFIFSKLSESFIQNIINIQNPYSTFEVLSQYDFSGFNSLISKTIEYCIKNPKEQNNEMFDLALLCYDCTPKEMVTYLFAYAKAYLRKSDFFFSKRYINCALDYDHNNQDLLKHLLLISIGCTSEENAYLDIYKLNDYTLLENILGLCSSDDHIASTLNYYVEMVIKSIKHNHSDIKVLNVFEEIIKYYPKSTENYLIKSLYNVADLCKEVGLFDKAEQYYSTISGIDSSEYKAHWSLLQCKLKCKNNYELVHQYNRIETMYEFNNALTAATNHPDVINSYIDCRIEQKNWIESQIKRKALKKKMTIFSSIACGIIALAIGMSLVTTKVLIPNHQYNNAVSMINNGNYEDAYESLKNLGYSDSSSQMLVAKAGMAFESGDYEYGIQNIYDAGGKVDISYDLNGGYGAKNQDIVQKKSAFIQNYPKNDGYSFYGWAIKDFSIESKKNEYNAKLILKACWKPIIYFIYYDLNGGTLNNAIKEYTVESETFQLEEPTKKGYLFVGWSGTGIDGTLKTVTIKKGTIGNKYFTANYEAKEYTITYNYDYDGNISSQKVSYDSDYNLETPTRLGYTFDGWYNEGSEFNEGNWKYDEDVTLTAKWTLIDYYITYDLNGGSYDTKSENPTSYNIESDDITLINPSKKGYSFSGWSGSGINGKQINVVIPKGSTGNKSYVANFSANIYTIFYSYGYDNKYEYDSVRYDSNYILKTPSRPGYVFEGWFYNNIKIENDTWIYDMDITLTAKWSTISYSISYDLDYGVNNPSNPSSYNVETDTFTLLAPIRDGYDFLGWSGTGYSNPITDLTILKGNTGDRVYKAHWKPHTYTIKFDPRGGDCAIATMDVDYCTLFDLPDISRDGYTFAGWFRTDNNEEVCDSTWLFLKNLTLYAEWNINTYTISYELNGGINNDDNPSSYDIELEDIILKNPTREGYTFAGWNSILGNNQFEPTIKKGSYGNLTFEAEWITNMNTIVFNGNGNTSGNMESIQGLTNSIIALPNNLFKKTGYHFIGWSFTEKGTVAYDDASSFKVTTQSVITFYAIWEANINTITFHGNGSDGGNMECQYVATNEIQSLEENKYTKTGYHFAGWSSDQEGYAEFLDQGTYKMGINNNYDLYALWEPNIYTITFDANEGMLDNSTIDVKFDSEFLLPVPSRDGYYFAGWFLADTQISDIEGNSLSKYSIAGHITIIAHWSPKTNVLILTDGVSTEKIYGQTNSLIRLPKNVFEKEGYSFAGWSTNQNNNILYYDRDLYKMGTNNSYTLFAVFEESVQTIDRTDWIPISCADDLLNIDNNLSGKYFLTNDIDMNGVKWRPIGYYRDGNEHKYYEDKSFKGTLDGNGYAIYNFSSLETVAYCYTYETDSYDHTMFFATGLIGYNFGTLINIKLFNANVKYSFTQSSGASFSNLDQYYIYSSLLCSYNRGKIVNCHVQGSLSVNSNLPIDTRGGYCGRSYLRAVNLYGICGFNESGAIQNCFSNVTLSCNLSTNMGEITGSSTNFSSTFISDDPVFFDKGYIWYYLTNGTYRYQEANIHRLIKTYDALETKNGYKFAGWSTTKDGDVEYKSGDECFIPFNSSYLILYPVWIPKTNTIQFHANGGIGNMDNQSILSDATIRLSKCTFEAPNGYHFSGWSPFLNGNSIYEDCSDFNGGIAELINLYAVWEPNENLIIFNSNTIENLTYSQTIKTDETITLTACSFDAPEGYYFAGWSITPNEDVNFYDCANITSNGMPIIYLYAIWKMI